MVHQRFCNKLEVIFCTLIDVMSPLSPNHLIWLDQRSDLDVDFSPGIRVADTDSVIQTSDCSSFRWRRQRRRRCRPYPPQRSPQASPAGACPKFGPLFLFQLRNVPKRAWLGQIWGTSFWPYLSESPVQPSTLSCPAVRVDPLRNGWKKVIFHPTVGKTCYNSRKTYLCC